MWEKSFRSWSLFIRVLGVTVIDIEGEIRLPRGVRTSYWQKHTSNKKVSLLQIDYCVGWHTTEANWYRQILSMLFRCFFFQITLSRLSENELKYVNPLSFYSRSLKFGSRRRGPFERTPTRNAYNWALYWNRKGTHVTVSRLKRICVAEMSATSYHCGGSFHDRQCTKYWMFWDQSAVVGGLMWITLTIEHCLFVLNVGKFRFQNVRKILYVDTTIVIQSFIKFQRCLVHDK